MESSNMTEPFDTAECSPPRSALPVDTAPYVRDHDGIYRPPLPIEHRDHEYPSEGFDSLLTMQRDHFWYKGRHRFILDIVRRLSAGRRFGHGGAAVDLGGGCGGWIRYLQQHEPTLFQELALADSSARALEMAADAVSPHVARYEIDLLDLRWRERWDVAFLLDVLEHIPDDQRALHQIRSALRPGGFLVVTTPALERFRTPIDDMSHHVRRYSRSLMAQRASDVGMDLVTSRYFMFFLSPLLLWSRRRTPDPTTLTQGHIRECLERSARIPPPLLNGLLSTIFALETPLGHWIPFPWGTSVLAVFRRPT